MLDKNQENTEDQVNDNSEVTENVEETVVENVVAAEGEDQTVEEVAEEEVIEKVVEKTVEETTVEIKEQDQVVEEITEEKATETVVEETIEETVAVVKEKAVEEVNKENTEVVEAEKAVEEIENKVAEAAEKVAENNSIPMLEYDKMELEALTEELSKLIKEYPVQQLKANTDAIKNAFNAKFGALLAEKKEAFLEEGGNSIDFHYSSPVKATYNSLLSEYKTKRDAYYSELDSQLKSNLEKRHSVINELKELIDVADTKTMYKTFKGLQTRWREIGPVPRNKYNDTWRNYHHHVERFYDLLHLSNDFRDLDFKHNLEEKIKLVERVEALLEKEDVNEAFKELQELHKLWKEDIGPVSKEYREEIWQKFSAASKKVHDKRHEYFRGLRSQYEGIIEKKLVVIESIEKYDTSSNKKHSDWQKSIKDIEALRQEYFNAGKLPYSKSEVIWQKFKIATKKFNQAKNDFYKKEKSVQQVNLDKKYALIELAESIKDSEDWENATNTMKKIQADWKKIGHVPRKFSDDAWKKFKTACNHYFERFHNRQNALNKEQQGFIDEKKAFLDTVKEIEESTIEEIQELIKKWRDLGELPRNVRHLESKFNKHIDKLLEGLSLGKDEIAMLKFKNMVDSYLGQNDVYKLNSEQSFVRKKIDEINKEIQQLENNLSFFSNAKDDNPLLVNVRTNIEKYRESSLIWKQKLDYLRKLDY
mgnify:CR=1 FL=1